MKTATAEAPAKPGLDALVEKYILLRDKKAELKKAYTEKAARFDNLMTKLEAVMLQMFEAQGIESVKTPSGTAYKTPRTTVGVADWDMVLEFVKEHEYWSMLERRVSKAAVEQWQTEYGDLPPGLNIRQEVVVNVRRS